MRGARGPIVWCVVAAALFGASTPAAKPLLQGLGALTLSGLLYLGAAIAVAPWALRDLRNLRSVDAGNVGRLAGAVVFGGLVGPVLLMYGLALAPAGSVSLWLNLETVFTAILAWLLFREHLSATTWVAVALVVAASGLLSPTVPRGGLAAGLVALACVAWGLDNNFTAIIDRFTPAQITFAKGMVAGVLNTCAGLWLHTPDLAPAPVTAALAIGAVGYGASLLLYIAGAQHLGATRSQLIFSTAPAWGLVAAWVALAEPIVALQLVAASMMALAIWVWYREQHDHRHAHPRILHTHWHRHDDEHHAHPHEDPTPADVWHCHEHVHEPIEHEHPHRPDVHHRHAH